MHATFIKTGDRSLSIYRCRKCFYDKILCFEEWNCSTSFIYI